MSQVPGKTGARQFLEDLRAGKFDREALKDLVLDEIVAFGNLAGYPIEKGDLSAAIENDQKPLAIEKSDWSNRA